MTQQIFEKVSYHIYFYAKSSNPIAEILLDLSDPPKLKPGDPRGVWKVQLSFYKSGSVPQLPPNERINYNFLVYFWDSNLAPIVDLLLHEKHVYFEFEDTTKTATIRTKAVERAGAPAED